MRRRLLVATLALAALIGTTTAINAIPAAPTNLTATVNGNTVSLTWNAPAGSIVIAYRLEAGTSPGASNVASSVVGISTRFAASGVPAGTYYVRIRAIDLTGEGPASNEIVLIVGGGGCSSSPNAPSGLTASVSGSLIVFVWVAPLGGCAPSGYLLHAGTAPGLSNLAIVPVGATLSFRATAPNGTYYVRVIASNTFGSSVGSNEITVSVGNTGPRTRFGPGQWRVGSDIASGRYYSDPATGCYWERQRGLSRTLPDVLANEFIGFDAAQWIVDILASDVAFESDSDCGMWINTPLRGSQGSIAPGAWLVGSQVTPGTYRVNAGGGCYWERLRDFTGTLDAIIDNEFISSARTETVIIAAGDAGFSADGDCGTWTRVASDEMEADGVRPLSTTAEIEWRRTLQLQQWEQ